MLLNFAGLSAVEPLVGLMVNVPSAARFQLIFNPKFTTGDWRLTVYSKLLNLVADFVATGSCCLDKIDVLCNAKIPERPVLLASEP